MNYLLMLEGFGIDVVSASGLCKYSYSEGLQLKASAIAPEGICPYLYHVLIPYRETFLNGGYFKWRKDKDTVEVLCPNPQGRVNVLLRRNDENRAAELSFEVKSVDGNCVFGYKKGDMRVMGIDAGLCPYAYNIIFPGLMNYDKNAAFICPSALGRVSFSIRRT